MPAQKRETKRRSTGRGRPTKYDPAYCERAIAHFREGGSLDTLAPVLGVTKPTIYAWRERHKEFGAAVEKGLELSELWWLDQGRRLVLEQNSTPAWIFNMKNRFGWKDKQELSGDKDQPVTVSIVKFGGSKE